MQEVLNVYIYISLQKQMDVVVFYLSITYFQFQFPLDVCFQPCLTKRDVLTSSSLSETFIKG